MSIALGSPLIVGTALDAVHQNLPLNDTVCVVLFVMLTGLGWAGACQWGIAMTEKVQKACLAKVKRDVPADNHTDDHWRSVISQLDTVINRQLSKASGILSFNGLLLFSLRFYIPKDVVIAPTLCILSSCLLLIHMMYVYWDPPDTYKTFCSEYEHAMHTCQHRSFILGFAIFLSVTATAFMVFTPFFESATTVTT